jgi:predicted GNAT family acetyltransferase
MPPHALDNVIWQALTTRQTQFAESSGIARRFIPEIGPLAGLREPSAEGFESLAALLAPQATISLFLAEPYRDRPGWTVVGGAPLLQMTRENIQSPPRPSLHPSTTIVELEKADVSQMVALTELTKPGPFLQRTHELGRFVGIRQGDKLVAMSGERLKVPGFTEVSAVCTHPQHTGRGYAGVLMAEVMRHIMARNETPFLHVREDNGGAIALYEKLGFRSRVRAHYAILRKG